MQQKAKCFHTDRSSLSLTSLLSSVSCMLSWPATTVLLLEVVPEQQDIFKVNFQVVWCGQSLAIEDYFTCLWCGGLVAGSEAIERWVVTVEDHWIDRVRLLQLKQELLHRLDSVVAAQVDHYLLDLIQT